MSFGEEIGHETGSTGFSRFLQALKHATREILTRRDDMLLRSNTQPMEMMFFLCVSASCFREEE